MPLISLFASDPLAAISTAFALIISLTFHECAHALVATKLGDHTAEDNGRLTLNPLAHLDPIGTIALLLVGFGWGKPVPYNPGNLKRKTDELAIALAGPISNLLLALLVGLALSVLRHSSFGQISLIITVLGIIGSLNVILAVFNLLPLPPLDGSKIVMMFLSPMQRIIYLAQGQWVFLALILIDVATGAGIIFRLMRPLLILFSQLTGVPSPI